MKKIAELKPKRGQKIKDGDYFAIPLENGEFSVGQILRACTFGNCACIIFNQKLPQEIPENIHFEESSIISALFVVTALIKKYFPIIQSGTSDKHLLQKFFPDIERFEQGDIMGLLSNQTGIVEGLANAYFGLAPWDGWYDPEYFDTLLVSPDKKPQNLIYKNK